MALDIAFARRAIPPPPPPPLSPRLCIINAVTRQKGFAIERDAPSFNQRRFLRILRALPPPPTDFREVSSSTRRGITFVVKGREGPIKLRNYLEERK